jgi:hypothetical protein
VAETKDALRERFLAALPGGVDGPAIYRDMEAEFEGEELETVAEELIQTVTAGCTADDFHNWDYDHLEFIIDMSNDHGFEIPRNLLNGLPEQLILLVDADKLSPPGCPDDDQPDE